MVAEDHRRAALGPTPISISEARRGVPPPDDALWCTMCTAQYWASVISSRIRLEDCNTVLAQAS